MNTYVRFYNVSLLDDLHNYFPAFLYDQGQFITLTDVFRYVNQQMYSQFNLFSRGYHEYIRTYPSYTPPAPTPAPTGLHNPTGPRNPTGLHNPTVRTPATATSARPTATTRNPISMTSTTETIDITPLFTTYLNPGSTFRQTPRQQTQTTHTGGFLAEALLSLINGGSLDPVIVRPTTDEITAGTSLRQAVRTDEQENCAICQDHYTEGQAIRVLNQCQHAFHKGCIDPWFERNVHCPVCRHDIRQEVDTDEL